MPTVPINWLAVIVAALAAWAIGALWYNPILFGKQWVRAHGYTPERIAEMQKGAARAYGGSLICFLAIALAVAVLVGYIGMDRWTQGAKLGLLLFFGLAAPLALIAHLYSDRRWATWVIDAGYQLVYFVVMGAIIGAWRG